MLQIKDFINQYQRKMWKTMITRKNFDINIWDVLEYSSETVYYMPYSGCHKFEVKTKNCLICAKDLDVGFRKNEFIVKTCVCSNDGKKRTTIKKLLTLFKEEQAIEILKLFIESRTKKFTNRIQYWVDLGYTQLEAEIRVKEIQQARSAKSPASKKGATEYTCRRPEFWIKKGYTKEEAIIKISEYQVTNGLKWYVDRYGDENGNKLYTIRINNWLDKMSALSMGVSKISTELFEIIDVDQKGRYGKNETTIRGKNKVYRVDYFDKEKRKIIEFFGEYWHADIRKFKSYDLIHGTPAYKIWERDEYKINDLKNSGYDILVVKERDYYNNKQLVIEKCVRFLNGN